MNDSISHVLAEACSDPGLCVVQANLSVSGNRFVSLSFCLWRSKGCGSNRFTGTSNLCILKLRATRQVQSTQRLLAIKKPLHLLWQQLVNKHSRIPNNPKKACHVLPLQQLFFLQSFAQSLCACCCITPAVFDVQLIVPAAAATAKSEITAVLDESKLRRESHGLHQVSLLSLNCFNASLPVLVPTQIPCQHMAEH